MLKRLICGFMITVAVSTLIIISSCGHYSAKGIRAELVWRNWMGA